MVKICCDLCGRTLVESGAPRGSVVSRANPWTEKPKDYIKITWETSYWPVGFGRKEQEEALICAECLHEIKRLRQEAGCVAERD